MRSRTDNGSIHGLSHVLYRIEEDLSDNRISSPGALWQQKTLLGSTVMVVSPRVIDLSGFRQSQETREAG